MLPLFACMFTAPILRVVPFQPVANTSHFHFEFVNLHYVPVAKSAIEQVKISTKGNTGNDIPFCTGKTLIKFQAKASKTDFDLVNFCEHL